uniref:Uncharacterized protein n=1 Tax=Magallana gigas TaxID=29159 RepID=A0A8W8I5J2_MAGGI
MTFIIPGFFLILFYLRVVEADCGVSSAGYALGCSVGYHCCSKEDHTCCKDGTVCMGKACLGWRAMIGVVGACLAAFLLVCAAVGYLGMKLVEHISLRCTCKRKVKPVTSGESST